MTSDKKEQRDLDWQIRTNFAPSGPPPLSLPEEPKCDFWAEMIPKIIAPAESRLDGGLEVDEDL